MSSGRRRISSSAGTIPKTRNTTPSERKPSGQPRAAITSATINGTTALPARMPSVPIAIASERRRMNQLETATTAAAIIAEIASALPAAKIR